MRTSGKIIDGFARGLVISIFNHLEHERNYNENPDVNVKDETLEKMVQDIDYILNGDGSSISTRALSMFNDNLSRLSIVDKVDLLLSVSAFIKVGKYLVPREVLHKVIKAKVLNQVNKLGLKYKHIVGGNPDLDIINDKKILVPSKNAPSIFQGKSFPTNLSPESFFKW